MIFLLIPTCFSGTTHLRQIPRDLIFCRDLIHYHTGSVPASVLFDDHTKNVVLAVHSDALAIVSLDRRMVCQNRDISENMYLDVRRIEHLKRGTLGPSQDSEPLSFCKGLSIGQNQNIAVGEKLFAIVQVASSFGVQPFVIQFFQLFFDGGGWGALHLSSCEWREHHHRHKDAESHAFHKRKLLCRYLHSSVVTFRGYGRTPAMFKRIR